MIYSLITSVASALVAVAALGCNSPCNAQLVELPAQHTSREPYDSPVDMIRDAEFVGAVFANEVRQRATIPIDHIRPIKGDVPRTPLSIAGVPSIDGPWKAVWIRGIFRLSKFDPSRKGMELLYLPGGWMIRKSGSAEWQPVVESETIAHWDGEVDELQQLAHDVVNHSEQFGRILDKTLEFTNPQLVMHGARSLDIMVTGNTLPFMIVSGRSGICTLRFNIAHSEFDNVSGPLTLRSPNTLFTIINRKGGQILFTCSENVIRAHRLSDAGNIGDLITELRLNDCESLIPSCRDANIVDIAGIVQASGIQIVRLKNGSLELEQKLTLPPNLAGGLGSLKSVKMARMNKGRTIGVCAAYEEGVVIWTDVAASSNDRGQLIFDHTKGGDRFKPWGIRGHINDMLVDDIDGDGKNDILVSGDQGVLLLQATDLGFSEFRCMGALSTSLWERPVLCSAPIPHSQRRDVWALCGDAHCRGFLNQGYLHFCLGPSIRLGRSRRGRLRSGARNETVSLSRVFAVDIDGNGIADLVMLDANGRVMVSFGVRR